MSHGSVAWQHLVSSVSLCLIFPFGAFVLSLKGASSIADIDLKEAQRFFAQTFSCGASVTAEDEIIIQGDFTDDIIDVIQEKWAEVSLFLRRWVFLYFVDYNLRIAQQRQSFFISCLLLIGTNSVSPVASMELGAQRTEHIVSFGFA